MGFGWLFIGYMVSSLMSFTRFKAIIEIVGCMLMWKGLDRLSGFNKSFNTAIYPLLSVLAVKLISALALVNELFSMGWTFISGDVVSGILDILSYVTYAAFHVFLFLAIASITKDLDLKKQNERAGGNLVMTLIYYLFSIVWMLPLGMSAIVKGGLGLFLVVARLFIAILNLTLIYSCYMYICPVGDEEMPIKKSRFEFINRFREAKERREQRITDDNVRMYIEARNKRIERKKKKNKKH